MITLSTHIVKTWFITKSTDNSVIHYNFVEVGQRMDSGQDELETFEDEQFWLDRLVELGVEINNIINI